MCHKEDLTKSRIVPLSQDGPSPLAPMQTAWLAALAVLEEATEAQVLVKVWAPDDWDEIEAIARG